MNKKIAKKLSNINSVTLQPLVRRIIGWNEIEEKIDTIHYFLNNYLDITKLPPATGLLRQVQLADTELLRIVTEILTKNNLTYWLDYGTLLGAVRHHGFIPWDDDLDIAMPREDYDKAINILPAQLEEHRIGYKEVSIGRFWIHIWEAGLMLDIFPFENTSIHNNTKKDIQSILKICRCYYVKHRNKTDEEIKKRRETMLGPYVYDNAIWFHNPEYDGDFSVYEHNTIFPLVKRKFEDYEFYCPNDSNNYLTACYGDYMSLPKSEVLHHKGSGAGIHNNSKKNSINMNELIDRLKGIHPLND